MLPRALKYQLARIGFDNPVLPPIGHSRFCLRYPNDCEAHAIDFRRRNIALTPERWDELNSVNHQVNRDIVAEVTPGNGLTEEWLISPPAGDCKGYAITKRHELSERGWPPRVLLLSEVVVPSGEHHLILVVRTKEADLVLDNLNANVRPVANMYRRYRWIRSRRRKTRCSGRASGRRTSYARQVWPINNRSLSILDWRHGTNAQRRRRSELTAPPRRWPPVRLMDQNGASRHCRFQSVCWFPSAAYRLPELLHCAESDVTLGFMRLRSLHEAGYGRNWDWAAA